MQLTCGDMDFTPEVEREIDDLWEEFYEKIYHIPRLVQHGAVMTYFCRVAKRVADDWANTTPYDNVVTTLQGDNNARQRATRIQIFVTDVAYDYVHNKKPPETCTKIEVCLTYRQCVRNFLDMCKEREKRNLMYHPMVILFTELERDANNVGQCIAALNKLPQGSKIPSALHSAMETKPTKN